MSYTNVFGNSVVVAANPSYEVILFGINTQLVWPTESTEGTPYVASLIDVNVVVGGQNLLMPPANTGSNGVACIVTNIGAYNFTLTDSLSNPITVIPPTQQWIVALTDNSTVAGTWRAYQLAATTSTANAGGLAGAGLQANGTRLQTNWVPTVTGDTILAVTEMYLAQLLVSDATTPATWTLANSAVLGSGWYFSVLNLGTNNLTIATTADLINGGTTTQIPPGSGGIVICSAGAFFVIGATLNNLPALSVAGGAMTVDSSGNLTATSVTTGSISVTGGDIVAPYLGSSIAIGLTATGTNSAATAYNLATSPAGQLNMFNTVASNSGVALSPSTPVGPPGIVIANLGINNLLVYASITGGTINFTLAPYPLAANGGTATFVRIATNTWWAY